MSSAEILESPTMTKPQGVEIMEQEDAVFEVQVHGIPEPDVDWYSGSERLRPSRSTMIEQDGDTHRLQLKSCDLDMTGPIKVTATNKAGDCTAETFLNVKGHY